MSGVRRVVSLSDTARAKAKATRTRRAAIKRAIAAGEMSFLAGLRDPAAAELKVGALVKALDRVGCRRAASILAAAEVLEDRRCGELTRDERRRLLAELERRWRRRRDSRSVLHDRMRRRPRRQRRQVAATPEQRAAARARANQMRKARAALQGRLNRSEIGLVAALGAPEAQGLRVMTVLAALPYVGDATARLLLRSARIPATRTCGELRTPERARLLAEVERRWRSRMPSQLRRARAQTADVAVAGGGGLAKAA